MVNIRLQLLLISFSLVTIMGCDTEYDSTSLGEASGTGPRIVFNPLTQPFAEIPLPNDLALIENPDTRTGLSWNTSLIRPSHHGTEIRERLNQSDGFGTFGSVAVRFDHPLLIETATEETIFLVNVEPNHPNEGQTIPLALGDGSFPIATRPRAYHAFDMHAAHPSLLFEATNRYDLDGDGQAELIGHYDFEYHRLYIRPLIPLDSQARYAVVLTKGLMGLNPNGEIESIRSPFQTKAHVAQLGHVERAANFLQIPPSDVAFGWTYTTGSVTEPFVDIREGIYGRGPLAVLQEYASQGITEIRDTSIEHDETDENLKRFDHRFILQAEFFSDILGLFASVQNDDNFNLTFENVDYLVFGSWHTASIRESEDRSISLNLATGEGQVGQEEVPFMITVPKTTEMHRPPFPVMIYFHGTGTSRFEPIAIADVMARQGIAVMSFDQVGHGPLVLDLPNLLGQNEDTEDILNAAVPLIAGLLVPERRAEFSGKSIQEALPMFNEVGLFAELAVHGRAFDYNENGVLDIAEGFFFPDPFRMCASFTQDLVDMLQMVKVLRNLSQDAVPQEPLENPSEATEAELMPYLLSGDFNADGILDIGGPNVQLSAAGTSLGGIHASMGAAIEPEIKTVTPIVAGGGLVDLMTRSTLNFILGPIFLEVTGNRIIGCPRIEAGYEPENGQLNSHINRLVISQGNESDFCRKLEQGVVANAPLAPIGTPVRITHLKSGHTVDTEIQPGYGFSLGVEADKGDMLRLEIMAPHASGEFYEFEAFQNGTGYERNSDEFRRVVALQQHAFDKCDPVNFVRALFQEPLSDYPTTNALFLNAIGDRTVPVASSLSLARAAGVFGTDSETWRATNQLLVDLGVGINKHYDIEDLLNNNPPDQPKLGPLPVVETDTGVSAIRFADVNGKHEYIAGYEKDGFQFGKFSQHQLAIFHVCGGSLVVDDVCIEDPNCPLLDDPSLLPGCNANLRW